MIFKINLNGKSVRHEGTRVGQHGITSDGERIFVDYSDPLYDEMAFTLSISVIEQIEDVKYIAFRDKSHDLTLFRAEDFYVPLDQDEDKNHYFVTPEQYNLDDKQVAVKMWEHIGLFEGQGKEFELAGGKYDEIDDIES